MASMTLALRADQGALVIEALAELPFKTVFELIGRLNRQANGVDPAAGVRLGVDPAAGADAGGALPYVVGAADLELIVGALGRLPYNRVHRLLAALEQQLRAHGAGPA